jgi:tRNA dimethylallyltransferase
LDGSSAAPIRVICGPTAAGKTFAAGWFAQHVGLAVISADSRQLYRRFDVGTAKPGASERTSIPHYGIDVRDPTERASAAWWAERADAWIDEAIARGRTPVVVGGTGLYIRSLFGTFFEEPPMQVAQRAAVQRLLDSFDTKELRRWVSALDPSRAHLGRTQLLRAVEIALLTGRRVSALHRENARAPRRNARYLVVDPGLVLASTIAQRARAMLSAGWGDEVRVLIDEIPDDAPAWNATGYRTIREMVQGHLSVREAEDRVVIETRQYAKRQRTWFRHQLAGENVTRLSTEQPDWAERAMAWWREENA